MLEQIAVSKILLSIKKKRGFLQESDESQWLRRYLRVEEDIYLTSISKESVFSCVMTSTVFFPFIAKLHRFNLQPCQLYIFPSVNWRWVNIPTDGTELMWLEGAQWCHMWHHLIKRWTAFWRRFGSHQMIFSPRVFEDKQQSAVL